MVGLDKLGLNTMEGCLTSIIYMPLYFIIFWYYTLLGWVFALMAIAEFKKENGSYICKELLGCDLSTKDGIDFALEKNLFTEFCPKMVESATKIAENILNS